MSASGEHRHGHGHSHAGHSHALDARDHRGRLAAVVAITVAVMAVQAIGSGISGSLALLADAGHLLTDAAGLIMALIVANLARRPATSRRTWGYQRAEIVGAAAQAALLLLVGVFVLVESLKRLAAPPQVTEGPMLLFGVIGLVGNAVGLLILAGGRGDSMNMRAAFLEVLSDALGSVAVIAAALSMGWFGWSRADAVASLIIGALIIPRTLRLLRESVSVLMETVPEGLDLEQVRAHVKRLEHVHEVHDLHASQISTGTAALTAHVIVDEECFYDGHLKTMLDKVQDCVREHFGIEHSTIQFEPVQHGEHEFEVHE